MIRDSVPTSPSRSLKLPLVWVSLVLGVLTVDVCDAMEKLSAVPEEEVSGDATQFIGWTDEAAQDTHQTDLNQLKSEMETKLNYLNSEMAKLKEMQGKTVAFHVWNSKILTGAPNAALVFDHIATNVGNPYGNKTGIFTAPVSGLYHFQTTFLGGEKIYVHTSLYVGEAQFAIGVSDKGSSGGWDQTTISCIVHAIKGQQVAVTNNDAKVNTYYGEMHTTFSGFLLHAD